MLNYIKESHIKNHFITNPEWERVFLKYYPNWNPEAYEANAKDVFEKNGFSFNIKRRSQNPNSQFYHVVEVELYEGEEWLFAIEMHDSYCIQQTIIDIICNYEVDISKFK